MSDLIVNRSNYVHAGYLSATDAPYSKFMWCDKCHVTWVGCWDNFQCPECGNGKLPDICDGNIDEFLNQCNSTEG